MADNIKIVGNILNTTTVSRYNEQDVNLISSTILQENFGGTGDYIEYYIYDAGGNLLNINYNYLDYKLPPSNGLSPATPTSPNTTGEIQTTNVGIISTLAPTTSALYPIIEIDPAKDIQNIGYTSGEFNTRYNFFKNILSNNIDRALFIKEISQDRTEIRLASTTLTNDEIESTVLNMINQINSSSYYVDYLINFGDNQQYVAVNVALNKANPEGYEVLFKMYEPLPLEIQEKQTLWVVEEKVSPYIFDINLDTLITPPPPPRLRGPNFDITIPNQGTVSTIYTNYNTAVASLQALQSSSYQQLLNLMTTQSISINVDYTNFNNFVFFGSAYQRVVNFYNKVKQIEDYNNLIGIYTPYASTTASLQTEINLYSSSINTIISQFDGYESYLYFESSSYAWPKSGSYKPYSLLSTGSATVLSWYNNLTGSALDYDYDNYDNLVYAVPNFIRDDEANTPFLTFLNMVGQYFDNIWIYLKAITDVNLANNNLNVGISKDLVYNQLQSLGIKLYNSQAGEAVDSFLIGANTGSNVFDNDFSLTGSYLNNIPRKDLLSELYKRIYHNLPLLLKTKGTKAGLDYLISTFGIPSRTYYTTLSGSNEITWYTPTGSAVTNSILNVKEYGGDLKSNLVKGYNDEKVRIVPNTITGSVLSSLLSLQTFPTDSNAFRENDMHYVDISFSPETQINAYVSGAIASNNPTWRLDDYIGDPRQLYSGSYPDLDAQRTLYFETGVTNYPGFTGSLLDYNGFIRLIEFFDNSLFKMLGDFVPERTSLSTGVTIESPVLERNKVVYPIPNVNDQEVYDADYSAPSVSSPYEDLYYDLGGDRMAYFDGDISGSELNTYAYFEETNFNPYLEGHPNTNWIIYNVQHPVNERININKFSHSDYDVLFNNVSKNVDSQYRKKIEYIWGTTGSLTSSVELQDSYLTLQSYNNSRYLGTQLTSKLLNTYTSASYTGSDGLTIQSGDISYGKTATVDRNSYKLGWIQSIPTQSLNFNDKTIINLRYLVDTKNEVTDLNSYNNNWSEVQNIFKSGKPAILSITDKNQNRRDGEKLVWKGGYRYDPILYRENGEILNFTFNEYQSTSSVYLGFLATDPNIYRYKAWRLGDSYPYGSAIDESITNTDKHSFFWINGIPTFNTFSGNGLVVDKKFSYNSWTSYISNITFSDRKKRISNLEQDCSYYTDLGRERVKGPTYRFDIFKLNNFTTPQFTTTNNTPPPALPFGYTKGFFSEPDNSAYLDKGVYKIVRNEGDYVIYGGTTIKIAVNDQEGNTSATRGGASVFKLALVVERANEDEYSRNEWKLDNTTPIAIVERTDYSVTDDVNKFAPENGSIIMDEKSTATFRIRFNGTPRITNLNVGDYIRFSFYFVDVQGVFNNSNYVDLTFTNTYWGVFNRTLSTIEYIYDSAYTSSGVFYLDTTNISNDTLVFYPEINNYFYSSSFNGSSLNYSEVIDNLSIQKGDLIKFGKFKDPGNYYEVIETPYSPFSYRAILSNSVTLARNTNASSNFAILRPKPDETSIILEGKRATGLQNIQTALLVPYDASTTLNNNVGTIIKSLNTTI